MLQITFVGPPDVKCIWPILLHLFLASNPILIPQYYL